MKFGKQLQAEIIPGWSEYYLDYKFLKKIVSSLAAKRPASEAASLALGIRPADILTPVAQTHALSPVHTHRSILSGTGNNNEEGSTGRSASGEEEGTGVPMQVDVDVDLGMDEPPVLTTMGQDDDRGPDFQAHKAAFFFKLERELEKINAFYLRKEAELKLRLETLLSKRRAAAMRVIPNGIDDTTDNYVEWKAVEEGFHLLERDLQKLQNFIEINATGFRKILKKWDKRSKSTTKELYLARQVDVQPVFNRQLISELSDTVTACLVDITDVSSGLSFSDIPTAPDVDELLLRQQLSAELGPSSSSSTLTTSLFRDLESDLRKAVANADKAAIRSIVAYSDTLAKQEQSRNKANITRVLWRAVVDAPEELADLILETSRASSSAGDTGAEEKATSTTETSTGTGKAFDWTFVDDINGRTCLHEASITGALRLVSMCLAHDVPASAIDVYGRSAIHYAAMNGHADVCRLLLQAGVSPYVKDMENYSPVVYATLKGCVDCVRVLVEEGGVPAQPRGEEKETDLIPLSLAALAGHMDVVLLLLEHGARSLPNSNGEYPIHFAARKGHTDICRLLVQPVHARPNKEGLGEGGEERHEGWDKADKYNEWTPLFHAARWGHEDCVGVLLEAGARREAVDEVGCLAVHWAAWYGHMGCVELLLPKGGGGAPGVARGTKEDAASGVTVGAGIGMDVRSPSEKSTGSSGLRALDSDIDLIPSLSLPPPMMPHRVYGHNYLDKQCLVQVTIGGTDHSTSSSSTSSTSTPGSSSKIASTPAVRLHPRLLGSSSLGMSLGLDIPTPTPLSSPIFKLVMTSSPNTTSAPHSISLPIAENDVHVQTFQAPVSTLERLSLEFSLYPNFGTKTVGRAVALPSLFGRGEKENSGRFVLPILDHRLHVIGEVSFGINIITPFEGVTLEIGGAVETYWKSLSTPSVAGSSSSHSHLHSTHPPHLPHGHTHSPHPSNPLKRASPMSPALASIRPSPAQPRPFGSPLARPLSSIPTASVTSIIPAHSQLHQLPHQHQIAPQTSASIPTQTPIQSALQQQLASSQPLIPTLQQPTTVSSVTGTYVHLIVQVTKDLQPVLYSEWRLPEEEYELGVADVRLEQFERLGGRTGRTMENVVKMEVRGGNGNGNGNGNGEAARVWHSVGARAMVTLEEFLKSMPVSLGVCLELAYPSSKICEKFSRNNIPLNDFIDAVLRTVYHTSALSEGRPSGSGSGLDSAHTHGLGYGYQSQSQSTGRRKVIFTSFSADACAAVNWKQPNYPVFFASQCGAKSRSPLSPTALTTGDASDQRLSSLHAAVEFAKTNNLLGVFLDADVLVTVPSLMRGVRDAGLLIGTYGSPESMSVLSSSASASASMQASATGTNTDVVTVDALFQEGVFTFP